MFFTCNFTVCFCLKAFILYVTREVLDHHGASLGKQHPVGFILGHGTLSMHVALAIVFVSQGTWIGFIFCSFIETTGKTVLIRSS